MIILSSGLASVRFVLRKFGQAKLKEIEDMPEEEKEGRFVQANIEIVEDEAFGGWVGN